MVFEGPVVHTGGWNMKAGRLFLIYQRHFIFIRIAYFITVMQQYLSKGGLGFNPLLSKTNSANSVE